MWAIPYNSVGFGGRPNIPTPAGRAPGATSDSLMYKAYSRYWHHKLLLAGMLTILYAFVGCNDVDWTQWTFEQKSGSANDTQTTQSAPAFDIEKNEPGASIAKSQTAQPIAIQSIDFLVLRIRAIRGTFSESGKIWNALNEEVLPVETQTLLRKNGLRVGIGKQSGWPQVKAILDAEQVKVFQNHRPVHNGLPLSIETDTIPRDQTLFLFRPDGTLPGATFEQSTNILRIEYWIPLDDADAVMLDMMPEIKLQRVQPRPDLSPQGWVQKPPYKPTRPLRELTARVKVAADEYVAFGPSKESQKPHLAGSLLLREEIDGRVYESMYIITPKIITIGEQTLP